MARTVNPQNIVLWRKHITNQKASNLSQGKWCEQNNVGFPSFRYWSNRLRTDHVDTSNNWATVSILPKEMDASKLMESNSESCNPITITIGNASIKFHKNTCPKTFAKVVGVLIDYV